MYKSRRVILVSHCILNPNSKVEGLVENSSILKSFSMSILKNDIGIIQLPCVEQDMCGIRRWGQVVEQLDHPNFRYRCRKLLTPIVYQAKDFLNNGYDVIGVVGIDGSPTCGVKFTSSGEWYGEIGSKYGVLEKASTLKKKYKMGIMMEELLSLFRENDIEIPFFSIDESNSDESLEKILKYIL